MRRILVTIILLCLVCTLAFGAHAATAAKSIVSHATVATDGTCQITLIVAIHLDKPVTDLHFPLPEAAENITVNGSRAYSHVENGLRVVDVSGLVGNTAGDFTLTFTYSLPNLVATNKAGLLELQLPLLSGFSYPVQALEFSVTLPGPVTAKPAFTSGYHQANIEKDLFCTVSGATIDGFSQVALKDHETLSMQLLVSREMFPQDGIAAPDFHNVTLFIFIFSLLALAYWLLRLRNIPLWSPARPMPPDGYTAGELGSVLHLRGGDLRMMVFSWAQLGYLRIRLERSGKVLLYRQMDMGNERGAFEQRCFKLLFGRRSIVDTGSVRFTECCRSVGKLKPNLSSLVHPKSGNPYVFRALAALSGMFCGVWMGIGLSEGASVQWVSVVLFGILALFSSYLIQSWAFCLLSPERNRLWLILGLCGIFILFGYLSGQLAVGLLMVLGQLLAGLLAAFGGRRTPAGRQAMEEAIGLQRYFKTVSQEQLRQIAQYNPEYFHQMLPYALALGVDKQFARRFGRLPVGSSPYISIGTESTMNAAQWRSLMRRVLQSMNNRQRASIQKRLASLLGRSLR